MSSGVGEWRVAKLGEIAALSGGTTPSKSNDVYWSERSVPWATPSDITSLPVGQTRIAATERHVAELALKECSLKLNPPNIVLMTSRVTIGYAVIDGVSMATNQGFLNFTCSDNCDPEYLCHWLNSNRDLLTAASGSTFKELSRVIAKLLPLPLSPFNEQRRITPGHVEVMALTTDDDAEIDAFLKRKRQWLFNTLDELEAATAKRAVVPCLMTGSEIPFQGRNVRLTVRRQGGAHVEIDYHNGFIVNLPSWICAEHQDGIVGTEIKLWLKQRYAAM